MKCLIDSEKMGGCVRNCLIVLQTVAFFCLLRVCSALPAPVPVPAACPASCTDALVYFVASPESVTNLTLGGTAQNFGVDILAVAQANNYELSNLGTLGDVILQPGASLRVPLPSCSCKKGNYSSDGITYTVQPADYLYLIAQYEYGGLLKYQDIARDNGIKNVDLIQVDQVFNITVPCTCLRSRGNLSAAAVPLAYVVQAGDDYGIIAQEFNTTVAAIESLNPSVNASDLSEGQVLQLALPACTFNLSSASLDRDLIIPNDAYAITAGSCVQCKCSADRKSLCLPAPASLNCSYPAANLTCPGTNLTIGSSIVSALQTKNSGSCQFTTCLYNGYTRAGILTRLEEIKVNGSCPEPPPPPPPPEASPPPLVTAPPPESTTTPVGSGSSSAPPPSNSATGLKIDLKATNKVMLIFASLLAVLLTTVF